MQYLLKNQMLCEHCFKLNDFKLGEQLCDLFLENNDNKAESYELMLSWKRIFEKLNSRLETTSTFIFIAPGGFSKWSNKSEKLGGSERYIVEMANYIQKNTNYNVYVFCDCDKVENSNYLPLSELYSFLASNVIEHCLISRQNEYIPLCIHSNVKNIYYTIHDLLPSNLIIPLHPKLKKIFCVSEWHSRFFLEHFPNCHEITTSLLNGIDIETFESCKEEKIPFRFIYSSFPNRGLLFLLKVWKEIKNKFPESSLDIYCDLDQTTFNGKWVNENFPEMMKEIQELLENLKDLDIINYGFVSKKELVKAWKKADIWFYPTHFLETCCITAIESAISKTLVVANIIGGLENTVGDRGINYKDHLQNLFDILENPEKKKELVEKNYQWSLEYDWKNVGENFLKNIN